MKKNTKKQNVQKVWDKHKDLTYILWEYQKRKREKGTEVIFDVLMAENFQAMGICCDRKKLGSAGSLSSIKGTSSMEN